MPPTPEPAERPGVVEAIRRRRTARRFDPDRDLSIGEVHQLIELATLGPMPMPLQPARFVVVRSLANRRRLRKCTFGDARLTEAPVIVILLGYLDPPRTDLVQLIDQQIASGRITPNEARRLGATIPRSWRDLGDPTGPSTRAAMAAATTLILAAEGLGFATAWVEMFDRNKVRVAFGIPDDHAVVALVTLGHPAEPSAFPGRLPIDQVVSAEHFGQPWPFEAEPTDRDSSLPAATDPAP